jgi:outer membrane protein
MNKKSASFAAVAVGLVSLSLGVQAYEPGDMVLRVGIATVDPKVHSDDIKINGAEQSGVDVRAKSDIQIGLTGTYIFAPHWGIELLASTPFKHDLNLYVDGSKDSKLGSAKQLPPTLSVQYYFADALSKFQPYVGVGLNYTVFFDESLSSEAKDAGFTDLKLDNSLGLALEAGIDYAINEHWQLNASIWKIDINTTGTANAGSAKVKVDYELDPWAYMVGVGYKF